MFLETLPSARLLLLLATTLTSMKADNPLDAQLWTSSNAPARLSAFRGKPTLLFYEDRASQHQNDAVKKELFARGKALNLLQAANVVAVADLRGFDFFPARNFALKAVRDVELKHHIPVLVDWNRTLCQAPWRLPADQSSMVLLDGQGHRVFERSGPMKSTDVEQLFTQLGSLLHEHLEPPSGAPR